MPNHEASDAEIDLQIATRAAAVHRVKVVEIATGAEHELPGDAATRDARTLMYFSYAADAVLPLVTRAPQDAFYVCAKGWPELEGRLVRRFV